MFSSFYLQLCLKFTQLHCDLDWCINCFESPPWLCTEKENSLRWEHSGRGCRRPSSGCSCHSAGTVTVCSFQVDKNTRQDAKVLPVPRGWVVLGCTPSSVKRPHLQQMCPCHPVTPPGRTAWAQPAAFVQLRSYRGTLQSQHLGQSSCVDRCQSLGKISFDWAIVLLWHQGKNGLIYVQQRS